MLKPIATLLLLLFSAAAFAQAPDTTRKQRTPEQRATAFAGHLEKSLALSPEQKTKVYDLALSKEQKMDKLREENKGKEKDTWAPARKQVRTDFMNGMKATLTPEQFAKWEEQKKNHHKKMAHHAQKSPEERAAGFAKHLGDTLGLAPDQRAEVQRLMLQKEQKMQALREKNKGKEKQEWAKDRQAVNEEFKTGMKATLTPEQFTKWTEMRKAHHPHGKKPQPDKKK